MTASERLEKFRRLKYSLYDKTNNMEDINKMNVIDFYGAINYIVRKNKMESGVFVSLDETQKRMIKEAKK